MLVLREGKVGYHGIARPGAAEELREREWDWHECDAAHTFGSGLAAIWRCSGGW